MSLCIYPCLPVIGCVCLSVFGCVYLSAVGCVCLSAVGCICLCLSVCVCLRLSVCVLCVCLVFFQSDSLSINKPCRSVPLYISVYASAVILSCLLLRWSSAWWAIGKGQIFWTRPSCPSGRPLGVAALPGSLQDSKGRRPSHPTPFWSIVDFTAETVQSITHISVQCRSLSQSRFACVQDISGFEPIAVTNTIYNIYCTYYTVHIYCMHIIYTEHSVIHTWILTLIQTHKYIQCMYIHAFIYTNTPMRTHIHTFVHTYIYPTYIRAHMRKYIVHTCIHIYAYMHK